MIHSTERYDHYVAIEALQQAASCRSILKMGQQDQRLREIAEKAEALYRDLQLYVQETAE